MVQIIVEAFVISYWVTTTHLPLPHFQNHPSITLIYWNLLNQVWILRLIHLSYSELIKIDRNSRPLNLNEWILRPFMKLCQFSQAHAKFIAKCFPKVIHHVTRRGVQCTIALSAIGKHIKDTPPHPMSDFTHMKTGYTKWLSSSLRSIQSMEKRDYIVRIYIRQP